MVLNQCFAQGWRLKAQGKSSCLEPRASSLQRNGFTLVELLIAATMISILCVGLGAHLRGGIAVWQHVTTVSEALQRERVAMSRLEHDLANAVLYETREEKYGPEPGKLPVRPFKLSSGEVAWFTIAPSGRGQPAKLRLVRYVCGEIDGTKGLWRLSQSAGEARGRREVSSKLLLMRDCSGLSIRYAYLPAEADSGEELQWDSSWENLDQLPRLVEWQISRTSEHSTERVFGIPAGVLKPFGEASQPPAAPPS